MYKGDLAPRGEIAAKAQHEPWLSGGQCQWPSYGGGLPGQPTPPSRKDFSSGVMLLKVQAASGQRFNASAFLPPPGRLFAQEGF